MADRGVDLECALGLLKEVEVRARVRVRVRVRVRARVRVRVRVRVRIRVRVRVGVGVTVTVRVRVRVRGFLQEVELALYLPYISPISPLYLLQEVELAAEHPLELAEYRVVVHLVRVRVRVRPCGSPPGQG